jgi:hypothetical protein
MNNPASSLRFDGDYEARPDIIAIHYCGLEDRLDTQTDTLKELSQVLQEYCFIYGPIVVDGHVHGILRKIEEECTASKEIVLPDNLAKQIQEIVSRTSEGMSIITDGYNWANFLAEFLPFSRHTLGYDYRLTHSQFSDIFLDTALSRLAPLVLQKSSELKQHEDIAWLTVVKTILGDLLGERQRMAIKSVIDPEGKAEFAQF